MNARAMIVAAAIMTGLSSPAHGQEASAAAGRPDGTPGSTKTLDVRKIERNYMAALMSTNEGVVESAIAQSVRMRWALPSVKLEGLRTKLGELADRGKTVPIRYKAYLAQMVFDSPSIFNPGPGGTYEWDEDLFTAVNMRAQQALLGFNGAQARGH